jgi:hypothetical protein
VAVAIPSLPKIRSTCLIECFEEQAPPLARARARPRLEVLSRVANRILQTTAAIDVLRLVCIVAEGQIARIVFNTVAREIIFLIGSRLLCYVIMITNTLKNMMLQGVLPFFK